MKDMCGNELKVGDLVIFVRKTARNKPEGTMDFGIISGIHIAFGEAVCSVTLAKGNIAINVRGFRIMKIENIANQYDQVKDTGDFQSLLDVMEGKK